MVIELFAIALGGALGALARYGAGILVERTVGAGFPFGTLSVNIIGSLLIGFAFVWLIEKDAAHSALRGLVIVGFLGAFTTFSTYSLQTYQLLVDGRVLSAMSYAIGSVILCLAATGVGVWLSRSILA